MRAFRHALASATTPATVLAVIGRIGREAWASWVAFLACGGSSRFVFVLGVVGVTVGAVPAHAILPCSDHDFCPVANEDNYTTPFNTKLVVAQAQGLLANDEGGSGVKVAVDESDTESIFGATVTLSPNGSFTYTPDPDPNNAFSGIDSFDYTLTTQGGDEDFNTAYITVVPTVANDSFNVAMTGTTNVAAPGIYKNDAGIDPTFTDIDTTNAHGDVELDEDGGSRTSRTAPSRAVHRSRTTRGTSTSTTTTSRPCTSPEFRPSPHSPRPRRRSRSRPR